ncbi:HC-toxin synthetase [Cordyceps javanica]|uniref:HC-toxin synthetase n=1 Tax=Cordyceps javanica TaxID=43265 RepID=A0A545UN69_9HYPO|nr:HC-toxin synthetase [Cordyceps javanica]
MNENMTIATDANNIGHPLASHVWVVDTEDFSRLAPVGCRGELLISGPTLACGHLSRDETAEAVTIDGREFSWALPGESRFYATGDLVRQNPDGSINYIAKKGQCPKLNGMPIEFKDMENEIERCEGIVSAMVEKFGPSDTSSEFLVAFVALAATTGMGQRCKRLKTTDHIEHVLKMASNRISEHFPPDVAPLFYLPISAVPLAMTGRMDRGALRCIFSECSDDEMAMYRPRNLQRRETRTSIEKTLQGFWAQIWSLDPSQIDLDSQFVALGGDSLIAIRLATMCREVGYKVEVADILRHSKFGDLAALIGKRQNSAPNNLPYRDENSHVRDTSVNHTSAVLTSAAKVCQVDESQIEDIYACTPTMEALIAVTARIPEAYVARETFQIPPNIDLQRFCSAWDLVSRRNPIMRTRICSILSDGKFTNMQVVCNSSHDWNESAGNATFDAEMAMGSSLIRYRIRHSQGLVFFEVLKHHAVFDGYSSAMLWEDFRYAYEYSRPPPTRPPFKKYVSYVYSQSENEAIEFWRTNTSAFRGEHFPALPSSQYIPVTSSSHKIEASLKWISTCPFTFATVVRAAWAIVLAMRSKLPGRAKNSCFAVTTAGRGAPVPGIEKMAGPTIATVPVVVEFDMNQSIAEYLSQIHEQAISMLPYEYYGLGQIQSVSAEAREASRTLNLLVVQPSQLEEDILPLGLTRLSDDQSMMADSFGLVTQCWQNSLTDTISLHTLYDPRLIQEQEVNGMLRQLSWWIGRLNGNSSSLSTLRSTIWSLAEDHEFPKLQSWNDTPQCSTNLCLHELVELSAARQPQDLAVEAHDGRLTYQQLNEAAIALKEALVVKHRIGPGDYVPLCFEKSVSMIVAMLGVLKAGAAYVPLDTSHPSSRLNFIIQEVKAKVVIVSRLQNKTQKFPVKTLSLDSGFPFIGPIPVEEKQSTRPVTPKDVAYVIFTSGSTGQPKGVVMEHGAASVSILEHGKRYQHDQRGNKTRALQFSSYTFDASVLDIFAVLAYGGCVCIPSEQDRMGDLQEVFARMRINFVDLTPTVAHLLNPAALPMLTALTLAGEMADQALIERWSHREPPLEVFVNSYGPTEAAISCAIGEISPEKPPGHVGKRLGGYLWIVDEEDHEHLVPIGSVGELVVSGPTLARGYLNDADKTNAAFIRNVHWIASQEDQIIYKTGDLARFDFDGNVEILGRKDDGQIKLNGLRIEVGEIEYRMKSCSSLSKVRHVAVAKLKHSGHDILAAFLQFSDCKAISSDLFTSPSETFRQATLSASHDLQHHLPQYMIPKLWIPVPSWPLNAAGKTDKKRLVSAAEALPPAQIMKYLQASNAARKSDETNIKTAAEKVLESAWKQVLSRKDDATFELHDDFFAVGGDSLRTIMLISLLKTKGIQVTAQDIFGTKTLKLMAGKLSDKNTEYAWERDDSVASDQDMTNGTNGQRCLATTVNGITDASREREMIRAPEIEVGVEDVYPASHLQLSYLIEGQKWCRAYYCWFFIDVGQSSILKVREACATVAMRHQILRTSFHLVGHECHQAVQKQAPNFKVLFSSFCPADWCEQLDKDVARPVSFDEVPTRFRLLIDADTGRRVLALGLSHAQYDGFCTPTILNDLSLAYGGKSWGDSSPPRYRDFIKHTTSLCSDEADCFWRERFKGSTLTSIVRPVGCNARPVMRRDSKHTIAFEFNKAGTSSYPVMLKVAWAIALSQMSQSSDITFGNLVSGRYAAFEGAQEVVGPCLNVIPFRVRIGKTMNFSDLLKEAHDQTIATIPFEATPFDRIAAQSPWPAAAGFNSIFQFQNIPGREEGDQILAGSDWKKLGSAVYGGGVLQSGACWLTAWPTVDGTARFLLRYSEETLDTSDAEILMQSFISVLKLINNDPGAGVASLSGPHPSIRTKQSRSQVSPAPGQLPTSPGTRAPSLATISIMEELKSIWRSVLGLDGEIKPEDSFFDVGGDSIAAARMVSACARMGLRMSLQDVIDFPSLISQADCVAAKVENSRKPEEELKLVYEDNYEFI